MKLIETGSFSLAADECYISPSAFSKQIRALEEELDTELFSRSPSGVQLTADGAEFTLHARKIVDEYYEAISKFARGRSSTDEKQSLTIASIIVLTEFHMISVCDSFQQMYPNIDIQITEGISEIVIGRFNQGLADIAILYGNHLKCFQNQNKCIKILFSIPDQMALLTSINNPLAENDSIYLNEARNETFYILKNNSQFVPFYIDACREAGFIPKYSSYSMRLQAVAEKLVKSDEVALLSETMARYYCSQYPDSLKVISLKDRYPMDLTGIAKKSNDNPAIDLFSQHIRSVFEK